MKVREIFWACSTKDDNITILLEMCLYFRQMMALLVESQMQKDHCIIFKYAPEVY